MHTPPNLNPFVDRPEAAPRRWSSRSWLILLLGIWGVLAAMMIACGGFGYFAMSSGKSRLEKLVREEIARHPVITEHLGPIESVSVLPKSPFDSHLDERQRPDFIVKAEGEKGLGFLWMYQSSSPRTEGFFSKIDLSLPSGERIAIK